MDRVIIALDNWDPISVNKQTHPNGVSVAVFEKEIEHNTTYKHPLRYVTNLRCMEGSLVDIRSYSNIPENTKYLFPILPLTNKELFYEKLRDGITPNYYWDNPLNIPTKVLNDVNNNLCKIVFMYVTEGQGDWSQKETFIKKQATLLNISLTSIVYVDANYFGPKLCSAYISYYYCNQWECYLNSISAEELFKIKNDIINKKDREKKFINFNRKARLHRLLLTEKILKAGLEKDMILTLGVITGTKKNCLNENWFKDYDLEIVKSCVPITYDIADLVNINPTYINKDAQLNAYICIVSETYFIKYETWESPMFFSEKTYKPITVLQPFIMVNCAYSLQALKEIGYKTFHPYINESYDNEEDDYKRLDMIYEEIKRLNSLSIDEIKQLMIDLLPLLIHNIEVYNINSKKSANGDPLFKNIMNEWDKNV